MAWKQIEAACEAPVPGPKPGTTVLTSDRPLLRKPGLNPPHSPIRVRAARPAEVEALTRLLRRIRAASKTPSPATIRELPDLVEDGLILVASNRQGLAGCAAIDPERGALRGPWVDPALRRQGTGRRLLQAAERQAATYQLFRLQLIAPNEVSGFFRRCGFRDARTEHGAEPRRKAGGIALARSFPRRQTDYGRRVARLGRKLGIPEDYAIRHRLPLQAEAGRLVGVGKDVFDRPQRLTPLAAAAWSRMQRAAGTRGIDLQLVSAYRSVEYQAGLLRRKLQSGQSMEDILAVSAAPGFSEHHSGRAIDLTTPGAPVLEEPFETTAAFRWLRDHASDFGFRLSYPRNNRHGVLYEPWHWYHVGTRRR